MEELNIIDKLPHYCPVCAYHEWNLDGLVEMVWDYIDVLRIYTKPKVSFDCKSQYFEFTLTQCFGITLMSCKFQ